MTIIVLCSRLNTPMVVPLSVFFITAQYLAKPLFTVASQHYVLCVHEPKLLFPSRNTFHALGYIDNNVCIQVTNCFSAHERVIFVFISELRSNEENKHKNNSQVSAETVRDDNTYISLFRTRHNVPINDDINDGLYTSSPCLTRWVFVLLMKSQSISDDVTMRQLWRDHINIDI